MDEYPSRNVLGNSNVLAVLVVNKNNASVESNESLRNGASEASSATSPSFLSSLTPRALATICHRSHGRPAHSRSENAMHASNSGCLPSPVLYERVDQSTEFGLHAEELSSPPLVSTTTSDEEGTRAGLISSIEVVVGYLVKDLVGNTVSIYTTVKARVRSSPSGTTDSHISTPSIFTSRPSFPGRTTQEVWRFSK